MFDIFNRFKPFKPSPQNRAADRLQVAALKKDGKQPALHIHPNDAQALANFLARLDQSTIRAHAASHAEELCIQNGVLEVRRLIRDLGFNPNFQ